MSEEKATYQTTARALLDRLGKPFPESAIKERDGGGRSKFRYVAGHTVIHRLNDATGGQWSWRVKSFDFRPAGTDRFGKDVSLVVVTGELTIPGLGTRAGIGVQKVTESGGEDLVKGASTDALKKAATLFGVALELYGEDVEGAASDRLDTAQVLAILGEMADAREPWHDIKGYADEQSAGRNGDDVLRIHDKLRAIATARRTAQPASAG